MALPFAIFIPVHPLAIAVIARRRRDGIGFLWFFGVLAVNVAPTASVDHWLATHPAPFASQEELRARELGAALLSFAVSTAGALIALFALPRRQRRVEHPSSTERMNRGSEPSGRHRDR